MDSRTANDLLAQNREENNETAYRRVFNGDNDELHEMGKEVLRDLSEFCFATRTMYWNDAMEMARREGRREVFMRIMAYLKYNTPEAAWDIETQTDEFLNNEF